MRIPKATASLITTFAFISSVSSLPYSAHDDVATNLNTPRESEDSRCSYQNNMIVCVKPREIESSSSSLPTTAADDANEEEGEVEIEYPDANLEAAEKRSDLDLPVDSIDQTTETDVSTKENSDGEEGEMVDSDAAVTLDRRDDKANWKARLDACIKERGHKELCAISVGPPPIVFPPQPR